MDAREYMRFTSRVELGLFDDDCWLWRGRMGPRGYGEFRPTKRGLGLPRTARYAAVRAHRWAMEWLGGTEPGDLMVCHRCDNPRCVNPRHLFLGTAKDNYDDMVAKGRRVTLSGPAHPGFGVGPRLPDGSRRRGEATGMARKTGLTDAAVAEYKLRRAAGSCRLEEVERLGVSKQVLYAIDAGKTWRHIPGPAPLNMNPPRTRVQRKTESDGMVRFEIRIQRHRRR